MVCFLQAGYSSPTQFSIREDVNLSLAEVCSTLLASDNDVTNLKRSVSFRVFMFFNYILSWDDSRFNFYGCSTHSSAPY